MQDCNFLYPHSRYLGQERPEKLVFNANLQYFSTRVSYLVNLQTNGKLSPDQAYQEIKSLWKQLKRIKKQLRIAHPPD